MKMVVSFPEYKINGQGSEWQKRCMVKKLRKNFTLETKQEFKVHLKVQGSHTGHVVGELAEYGLSVHNEVRKVIHSFVENNITNVEEISRHLELSAITQDTSDTNSRFCPKSEDIRNHVTFALRQKQLCDDDQGNLLGEVNHWKERLPDDNIFFRPMGEDAQTGRDKSVLFVYQSSFQRDLLAKYGNEMVLMDSTYNTTKYELALFLFGVCTNVRYYPVAMFVISKEIISNIKEALAILKQWNNSWRPKSFMCDFDHAEIAAIEETFEDIDVFTCDFHREQAWLRWLNRSDSGAVRHKETILKQLRKIANADSEEEYEEEVRQLKETNLFKELLAFQNWIVKQWLLEKKVIDATLSLLVKKSSKTYCI